MVASDDNKVRSYRDATHLYEECAIDLIVLRPTSLCIYTDAIIASVLTQMVVFTTVLTVKMVSLQLTR